MFAAAAAASSELLTRSLADSMASWSDHLRRGLLDGLDGDDDSRVGSGRDGSGDGGTLSQTTNNKTSSASKLGGAFVPVAIYTAVCLIIFIVLRRRIRRVYAPRTIGELRYPEFPTPAQSRGWFSWIKPFFQIPDTFVLNHGSIDGFFFLRFLKVLRNICAVGCLITWPVLFPIHLTGGKNQKDLDALTMGNVKDNKKLYAHAVMAWIFFGFVVFMIIRESIYYVNLRQAYLSSPFYADRLSSRTVLFTCVPNRYLDDARLRKMYGDSVRRVWIPRSAKALAQLVKEREQTALRLETAEIKLIKTANAARKKELGLEEPSRSWKTKLRFRKSKKAKSDDPESQVGEEDGNTATDSVSLSGSGSKSPRESETGRSEDCLAQELDVEEEAEKDTVGEGEKEEAAALEEPNDGDQKDGDADDDEDPLYKHPYGLDPSLPDVRGSVAAQWLPTQSRPHHRPLAKFGSSVDTIRWTRERLKSLNAQIAKMRRRVRRLDNTMLPAAFVEFDSQESAQAAHQVLAHHRPFHMTPKLIGIRPDDIVWSALRVPWWQRNARRFAIRALIAAAIIFWSIPSAFVSILSSISFLVRIPFLSWIVKIPKPILGVIEGFLPPALLSLVMAVVPILMRYCAKVSGVPALTLVELFTQTAYFAFQVVQVFLITTLASTASSAFFDILKDPPSIQGFLAKNLPLASNFYLSYILIQCLANGGTSLVHPIDLLRHLIMPRISDNPRTRYRVWYRLRRPGWGREFPVFTNLGVIAMCYACIAPLILGFASIGMAVIHVVWRYNLIYVYDSTLDSKGLHYPRALGHLMVGVYMACFTLVGLFAFNKAYGPLALMVIFLIFAVLMHLSLLEAIGPHLQNLPQNLPLEEQIQAEEKAKKLAREAQDDAADNAAQGAASSYYDPEQEFGDIDDDLGLSEDEEDSQQEEGEQHQITGTRGLEGGSALKSSIGDWLRDKMRSVAREESEATGLTRVLQKLGLSSTGNEEQDGPPGWLVKWLHPEEYQDFVALRTMMPEDEFPSVDVPEGYRNRHYAPPEMWHPKPTLWIPQDEARVSRQEVAHTSRYTPISDKGARLNKRGKVEVDVHAAPFKEPRLFL